MESFLMIIDSLETMNSGISDLQTILGATIDTNKLVATIVICSDESVIPSLRLENKFLITYNLE